MKEKEILVTKEISKELKEMFGVSPATISLALKYKLNSHKAMAIRAAAMERGARLFDGTRDENAANIVVLKQGETLCGRK